MSYVHIVQIIDTYIYKIYYCVLSSYIFLYNLCIFLWTFDISNIIFLFKKRNKRLVLDIHSLPTFTYTKKHF